MGQKEIVSKRDTTIDTARALSALWVVGFWHLICYAPGYKSIYSPVGQCITDVFMACFMYISVVMLNSYKFKTFNNVAAFFIKRFKRFYILYFIAALTLYIANLYIGSPMFTGSEQLVLTLLGLTSLLPPHAGFLWFMSMIMLFYLLTPLLMIHKKRSYTIIIGLLILLLFVIWMHFIHTLDKALFIFFPIYVTGLLTDRQWLKSKCGNLTLTALSIIFCVMAIFINLNYIPTTLINIKLFISYLSCIFGSFSIIFLSYVLQRNNLLTSIFLWIAYGSLCSYLFHRHFYSIIDTIFTYLNIVPTLPLLIFIYLPTMLFGTYLIQLIYDKLMNNFTYPSGIRVNI